MAHIGIALCSALEADDNKTHYFEESRGIKANCIENYLLLVEK